MHEVEFYENPDGKRPFFDFLESLSRKHKAKTFWEIDLLSEKGRNLSEPYVKPISDELWELRIQFQSDISRIFYFITTKDKIVLLHGFIKKTRKTPPSEIKIAEKRWIEYKERQTK